MPGVHNSRRAQSPHIDIQKDPGRYGEQIKPYLTALLTRFKDDKRILAWDLLNNPGTPCRNTRTIGNRKTRKRRT